MVIKKIFLACSYDTGETDGQGNPIISTGCKFIVFRPLKDGQLKRITSFDIPDRDTDPNKLYSLNQESLEIDCDIWVSKGDLIGVYNLNLYVGKAVFDSDADATYYQTTGEAIGTFDPGKLLGNGNAGLLVYARSDYVQTALDIEVDLQNRINIDSIILDGATKTDSLEFNIARCLDINWQVDLFNKQHTTGYYDSFVLNYFSFDHDNEAYGLENLNDGIYSPSAGLAANSYTASDAGGVVTEGNHYFYVNGDEEWVGVVLHVGQYKSNQFVEGFTDDPIAIYSASVVDNATVLCFLLNREINECPKN